LSIHYGLQITEYCYKIMEFLRVTSRVLKTLRGSSDDIGWLQHAPGMPPVHDGTSRFLELLSDIRSPILL